MVKRSLRNTRGGVFSVALLALLVSVPAGLLAIDDVTTVRVASDFNRPIMVTAPEGDFERLFIVEQRGVIKILNLLTGEVLGDPFLDIDGRVVGPTTGFDERGLLGLAFHPDFLENGAFFVHYSGAGGDTVVSRFMVDEDDPNRADDDSEVELLEIDQPAFNHNGGTIAFSPEDGYLYLGFGDGGGAGDTYGNGQSTTTLLGKMLRIDVNDLEADEYSIPDDNPFVDDDDVEDEIWAIGMRNPYRWSFDRDTGDLWIGDVGQGDFEEIDFQSVDSEGGENYGWPCMEGFDCTSDTACDCDDDPLVDPIIDYGHTGGRCSVTGGFVYRGAAIPALDGFYFYADWCSDDIYVLTFDGEATDDEEEVSADIAPGSGLVLNDIAGFGEDGYGELYIVSRGGTTSGEIFKLVPADIADDDCNGNFIIDDVEIEVGLGEDCDDNDVLDECDRTVLLAPSDASGGDVVGSSVAISGDRVLLGAPFDDDDGINAGAVHAFFFDGDDWVSDGKIVPEEDAEVGARFGFSVAIDGDRAAVGSRLEDDGEDNSGAVFVYEHDGDEWIEQTRLKASDVGEGAEFGYSVDVDGRRIVVGARRDEEAVENGGAAYIFDWSGEEWVQSMKLAADEAEEDDEFGISVALDGNTTVVGAHFDNEGADDAGAVYVFERKGSGWLQTQKLIADDAETFSLFGFSVDLQGDRIAVGAWLADSLAIDAGAVYIFERDPDTGVWTQEAKLTASDAGAGNGFGKSVALDFDVLVVGSHHDDSRGSDAGSVYVFGYDGDEWSEVWKLLGPGIGEDSDLGFAVAAAGRRLVGGAPGADGESLETGIAFVYELQDCNGNGVHDACDIADGTVDDCNDSGVPDSCELRIETQPLSESVPEGLSVEFEVEVSDVGPGTLFRWRVNGADIPDATAPSYFIPEVTVADEGDYDVLVLDGCLSSRSKVATLTVLPPLGVEFLRGDANSDGEVSALADGLFLLFWQFLEDSEAPTCMDAADSDDSGNVSGLADALYLFRWGFLKGWAAPPDPGPVTCGLDPDGDDDDLGCEVAAEACL